MKMFTKTLAAAAIALTAAVTVSAFASDDVDPALKEKVTKQLTEQGYDVRKVQMEDGMIEVYAVKDGKTLEIYLDDQLKIVKTSGDGEDQG